jgi:hypothetical protein
MGQMSIPEMKCPITDLENDHQGAALIGSAPAILKGKGNVASTTLDEILTRLPTLGHDDLLAVRDRIDRLIEFPPSQERKPLSEADARRLLKEQLLAQGTISRIPSPALDTDHERYEPIRVEGKPVSETIIEERR